jgi:glycosyltransferase domain-containing protein
MMNDLLDFLKDETQKINKISVNLSKLSIVIPSYERHTFLLRQCMYLYGSGATIFLIDGSTKPLNEEIQKFLNQLENVNYIHMPGSVVSRLRFVSNLINTQYTVTSNDDDFLLCSALNEAIENLDSNQELVGCSGQLCSLKVKKNKKSLKYSLFYNLYLDYNVLNNKLNDRLDFVFNNYLPPSFAVLRTEVWQDSWGNQPDCFSTSNISELFQAFSVYIKGKMATMKYLYIITTNENSSINTDKDNRNLLIKEWYESHQFESEKEIFINEIARKIDGFGHNSARSIVTTSLENYIKRGDSNSFLVSQIIRHPNLKKQFMQVIKFAKKLQINFYLFLKRYIVNFYISRTYFNKQLFIKRQKKQGFLVSDNLIPELTRIENLIQKF